MRKVIAAEYVSIDGVMEEPRWTAPYWNHELADLQRDLNFSSDALLLGRKTYQGFAQAWLNMTDPDEFASRMNTMPKYVASRTLQSLEWNASLLRGDVVAAVRELKQQSGGNLLIYGSGELMRSLMTHDLIDEFRLMIHPVVLGKGMPLFGGSTANLKLVDSKNTSTGVSVLTYQPDTTR